MAKGMEFRAPIEGRRKRVSRAFAQPKTNGVSCFMKKLCYHKACFTRGSVDDGASLIQWYMGGTCNEQNFHPIVLAEKLGRGKHQACTAGSESGNR